MWMDRSKFRTYRQTAMDSLMDRLQFHTDSQTVIDGLTDGSKDGWMGQRMDSPTNIWTDD